MKLTIRRTLLFSLALFIVLAVAALLVLFYRINRTVLVDGVVNYRKSFPVTVLEGGYVRQIVVEEDSPVEEGDIVLVLTSHELDIEIAETERRLAMTETEIESMEAQLETDSFLASRDVASLEELLETRKLELEYHVGQYDMRKELYRTGSITREQYDASRLTYRTAEGAVAEIEIQLSKAVRRYTGLGKAGNTSISLKRMALDLDRKKLDYLLARRENLIVRAPGAGVLLSNTWSSIENTFVTKGSRVADIVSFDEIDFVGLAKDTDVIRIAEGQRSYFDVELFRRKVFVSGTVTDISYRAVEVAGGLNAFPVTIEVSDKRFFDRDREFYIQAGVRGQAVIVVEEDLSLITLVWEKIVNFVDFGVNAE